MVKKGQTITYTSLHKKTKDWTKRTPLKAGWKIITDYNYIPTKTEVFIHFVSNKRVSSIIITSEFVEKGLEYSWKKQAICHIE